MSNCGQRFALRAHKSTYSTMNLNKYISAVHKTKIAPLSLLLFSVQPHHLNKIWRHKTKNLWSRQFKPQAKTCCVRAMLSIHYIVDCEYKLYFVLFIITISSSSSSPPPHRVYNTTFTFT